MRRTLSSFVTALLITGAFALPVGGVVRTVQAAGPPPAFVAPAGGTITGQVTDDRGAPLAGVTVQVQGSSSWSFQTSVDGKYTATGLAAGSYRVLVDTGIPSPPTFSPLVVYPELIDVTSTLGQAGVDFTVPRPAIVAGFVRNAGGIGVPNAAIGGLNAYVPVGPDGHFVAAISGGARTIGAGAPGYVGWNGLGFGTLNTPITAVPGQVTSVDFTLDAGGSISGHVVDANGSPVVGAYVSAWQPDVIGDSSGSSATDSTGYYQITALGAGSYVVAGTAPHSIDTVYFPGTADVNTAGRVAVVDLTDTPGIDLTLPVALPLGPPITVTSVAPLVFRRGTTTTATFTGTGFIVGGSVSIGTYGPGPSPTVSFLNVVDSQHFLASVTVPPDAPLGADGGMYIVQQGQSVDFGGQPFVADATSVFGTISGHVTRASDGTPIANVQVSVDQVGGPAFVARATSLSDGSYVLGPVPPGNYAVRFSPFIYPDLASELYSNATSDSASTPVTVIGDTDTPGIDAALDPADIPIVTSVSPSVLTPGTTTDVVVTGTGFGIDNGYYIDSGSYYQTAPRVVSQRTISSTEAHLSILVDPLTPSGQIGLGVLPRGGGAINECRCLSIATSPETTGTVVGSVTDSTGSGLGSIHVTALADGHTQPTSAGWTAADGTYALRVPTGTYTLHFEDLAGAAIDVPAIAVTVGQITQGVDATVAPLAFLGGLSGLVIDVATGLPIGHALVQFTNLTTGDSGGVLADAGGNYHFATLPAGDYTVEFSAPGYDSRWYVDAVTATAAAPVTVVAGAVTSSINAALPSARRPLSVSSIQPNRMAVGETLANVVVTGAGFVIGNVANLSFSAGAGVTITSAQATSDTSATLSLSIDPAAVAGVRDVIATRDDGQQVTCHGCLRVFAALGSISGTASLGTTSPSSITVIATSTTTGELFNVSAASGSPWTLDRLPAGDYTVAFSAYGYVSQWYSNASSLATATPVTVGSTPVTGVDAVLQAARKYLSLYYTSPNIVEQGSQTTITLTGSGFLDGGVTGLTLDAGVGATVQSVNVSSDSSATAVVTVASDAPLGMHALKMSRDDGTVSNCVCFQVVPAPGRITGHVAGANGLLVGWVYAFPAGSPYSAVTAQVQPDGSYSLDHLAPGNYQIEFGGYTTTFLPYLTQWWNGAATQASATTVTVVTGQTVTGIDAQLQVAPSPLTLYAGYSYAAYQGTTNTVSVYGSGFLNGVTGLTFSAGPGVTVAINSVAADAVANVTITTDPGAAVGARDLVVTRDDGQSATCTGCIDVAAPPPGIVYAVVLDADTNNYVSGTATLTKVGDAAPTWSQAFYATLYASGLAPGDYDLSIDAPGYQPTVIRVTVIPGQTVYLPNISMQTIRQPLSFAGPSPLSVYQGFPQQFVVTGSGFRSGGVTGLAFDAGPDVTITVDTVSGDTSAAITVSASTTAAVGPRDLTITRDDGQVAVCTGCLIVSAPSPGSISGVVQSSDSYNYLSATITVTAVGASAPTTVVPVFGTYTISGLVAGDYDVLYESPGYTSLTRRLTVLPGQDTYTYTYLDLPRQPLTITSVYPNVVDTGAYYASLQVSGSGFRAGGVTGLSASLGPNVRIESIYISSDSLAYVYVTVPVEAPLGAYDLVVTRDPGETSTCAGCVTVRRPPGFVYGTVSDVTCCTSLLSTVTATKVGDTVPTATISTYGYYGLELPEGDYIIKVDADGYASQWWNHAAAEVDAVPVSVASGVTQFGIDFALTAVRAPLSIAYVTPAETYQGETHFLTVVGSGFLNGGVSALAFGGGVGVDASIFAIYSDTFAVVGFTAADYAALGTRDVTVTRDDGQTATCASCLSVLRGQPYVSGISPSVVREGTRTLTVSGLRLQRATRVTTSSRKVTVQSYKNNRDGTITVRVKIDSGARKTYTLTFTRDDGVTFTADFSVVK